MPDVEPTHPDRVSQRDLWEAIERLRQETSAGRHIQGDAISRAIADLDVRIDTRLRLLENVIAATNPATLGPRVHDLEIWQGRVRDDVTDLPKRVDDLERSRDQQRGVVIAIGILASGSAIISTVVGVINLLRLVGP